MYVSPFAHLESIFHRIRSQPTAPVLFASENLNAKDAEDGEDESQKNYHADQLGYGIEHG